MLALMAEGRSNSAIADRLVVALKTVESHIANIFTKLDLPEAPTTTAGCSPCSPLCTAFGDRGHHPLAPGATGCTATAAGPHR